MDNDQTSLADAGDARPDGDAARTSGMRRRNDRVDADPPTVCDCCEPRVLCALCGARLCE